jgi:cell wall-associated NlpC family hydrolase
VLAVAREFAKAKYKSPNADTVFGKWYGLNFNPWCAMFVSYCMNKAGAGHLIAGAQNKKGFASCRYGIAYFAKKKQVVKVTDAKAGDIVFFDWDGGSADHVGFVVRNDKAKGILYTLEGNTTSGIRGSQANGGGVFNRSRAYSLVHTVARPAYGTPAPTGVKKVVKKVALAVKPTSKKAGK